VTPVSRLFATILLFGLLSFSAPQQSAPAPAAPVPATPQTAAPAPAAPAEAAPAQLQGAEQPSTNIRVQVNEVIVPVTVTDDKGKFVSNLVASDFRVLDEGRPQRISFFSHEQKQPIVVGFLMDLSNSSRIHWKTYQEALKELVWGLLPGDKDNKYTGYLIGYANVAELLENTTWDGEKITAQIDRQKAGGGSALFDAIYLACTSRQVVKGEPFEPRRVIVIMGDGHDNTSTHSLEDVLQVAQRNLVTIYAVSTQAFGFANETQNVLERLTSQTGGHVEYPLNTLYRDVSGYLSTPSDEGNYALTVGTGGYAAEISGNIIKAVGGIAGEVQTQYVLRYNPDMDPELKPRFYRKIKVDIPSLPTAKVYARDGYYPFGAPPASTP
jgi:VWFA-related protein